VDRAHTQKEAVTLTAAHAYDLVLVNRILDRDRSKGVDVIATLHQAHPALRLILVSDYPEAQEEAVKAGAIRGFGKAALETTETEEFLRGLLSNS
jgi:ActR/RegA family two-component response regulator